MNQTIYPKGMEKEWAHVSQRHSQVETAWEAAPVFQGQEGVLSSPVGAEGLHRPQARPCPTLTLCHECSLGSAVNEAGREGHPSCLHSSGHIHHLPGIWALGPHSLPLFTLHISPSPSFSESVHFYSNPSTVLTVFRVNLDSFFWTNSSLWSPTYDSPFSALTAASLTHMGAVTLWTHSHTHTYTHSHTYTLTDTPSHIYSHRHTHLHTQTHTHHLLWTISVLLCLCFLRVL